MADVLVYMVDNAQSAVPNPGSFAKIDPLPFLREDSSTVQYFFSGSCSRLFYRYIRAGEPKNLFV
jgi:hypothetical protein